MGLRNPIEQISKILNALSNTLKIWIIIIISAVSIAATQTDTLFEVTKNIEIFTDVYRTLQESYVDEPQPGSLIKAAIDAMLNKLDPYTVYYPESRIEEATFMQTGQYGGIGINTVRREDKILITDVYDGFGADKAGLQIGDYILAIDGQKVSTLTEDESGRLIKGQPGTSVVLDVKRGDSGKEESITVNRESIKNNDVPFFGIIPSTKTGYIKLEGFTQTAAAEVRDAYTQLKSENMEQLILDLRGNGGGLLREAVAIVNFFVPKGSSIVETRGRIAEWKNSYVASLDPLDTQIPLIVLIDEKSASASEIVSGSLQDLDRAVVIGKESYGKGLVQQTVDLAYNAKMKLTVAKYYIPSGRCVQRLDYSHRDESTGKVNAMADSSLKTFLTKNGRKVIDGRGIQPDIPFEEKTQSPWIKEMSKKFILFDFVTQIKPQRTEFISSIDTTGNFHLDESQWKNFISLFKDKTIKFESEEYKTLLMIKKDLIEKEMANADDFVQLEKKLTTIEEWQLNQWKVELAYLIEIETIRRLKNKRIFYKQVIKNDPLVKKAVDVFVSEYNQILQTK
jgi:carboxyl-terminal processing protease